MVKNIKYFTVFIILFILMSISVKAEKASQVETCVYNFPPGLDIGAGNDYLTIKISGGNFNPFLYWIGPKNVTKEEDKSFINGASGAGNIIIDDKIKNAHYGACPKYGHYKFSNGNYYINFSDNEKDEDYDGAIEKSKGEVSGENTELGDHYYNAQCNADWLEKPPETPNKDDVYCLYAAVNEENKCYVLQFSYTAGDASSFKAIYNFEKWDDPFSIELDPLFKSQLMNSGGCIPSIGVGRYWRGAPSGLVKSKTNKLFASTTFLKKNTVNACKVDSSIKCSQMINYDFTPAPLINSVGGETSNLIISPTHFDDCTEVLGEETINILKNLVTILKILIPIILNVFGIIDFGSAIFANDEEKMKKAQRKFITRLIVGVIIFLIPSLISLILNLANNIWPTIDKTCLSKILD